MFTKRDDGDADQGESSISRLAGRLAIMDFHETDSGERSTVGVCVSHLCDQAVMGDGPGTGVWQWGPCSGVGEAGRPGGQRRSVMTAAAAVGVGGLALWHGHPAGAQVSSVVRASGRRWSILQVHLSSPLRLSVRAYSERETGWRCDVCMPFDTSTDGRTDRDNAEPCTAVDIKAHTPLIRFVVDLLVCCTWPSLCTKWRAQTIWVTRCSPVVQCTWRLQQ